tara:strand:+ start:1359 stop:1709 length:351 start_codon:yes stop_codon:yes gene_type:complete
MIDQEMVVATAKRIPGSAQKARLVADLVRGELVMDAMSKLRYLPQSAANSIAKVIKSASANAEAKYGWSEDDMIVQSILVDEGPSRMWRKFGARGRFKPIKRRTSHIKVTLVQVDD